MSDSALVWAGLRELMGEAKTVIHGLQSSS